MTQQKIWSMLKLQIKRICLPRKVWLHRVDKILFSQKFQTTRYTVSHNEFFWVFIEIPPEIFIPKPAQTYQLTHLCPFSSSLTHSFSLKLSISYCLTNTGVSLMFLARWQLVFTLFHKLFELNFCIRKTSCLMVKQGRQNHSDSRSICQVPSPRWNPCNPLPFLACAPFN